MIRICLLEFEGVVFNGGEELNKVLLIDDGMYELIMVYVKWMIWRISNRDNFSLYKGKLKVIFGKLFFFFIYIDILDIL